MTSPALKPDQRNAAQHWSVTVERSGEKVVTIETNCLSGRDLCEGDEEAIRTAAHHLLSFIGDGAAPAWQPIETAPRDGTEILVWAADGRSIAAWSGGYWYARACGASVDDGSWDHEPLIVLATLWQPLPPAPEPPKP